MTYYKGLLIFLSVFEKKQKEESLQLTHYPTFNILLPNYKEKEQTIRELIGNVNNLNYPKDKIFGFLIVQEDDQSTKEAIAAVEFPSFIQLLIIPSVQSGEMQSKPRALNYALKK